MKKKSLLRKILSKTTNKKGVDDTPMVPRQYMAEPLEARILYSGAPVDVDMGDEAAQAAPASESAVVAEQFDSIQEFGDTEVLAPQAESGESDQEVLLSSFENLTDDEIQKLTDAAIERWKNSGLTEEQVEVLEIIEVSVIEIEGLALGYAEGTNIYLDSDAFGQGWWVDSTPLDDVEFYMDEEGIMSALDSAASNRMDLLTVMMHEMGHVIGLEDLYSEADSNNLMFGSAQTGVRILPVEGEALEAVPGSVDSARLAYNPNVFTDDAIDAGNDATSFTLREAILAANSTGDDDVITLAAGTYELGTDAGTVNAGAVAGSTEGTGENAGLTGDLDITNNGTLTIVGQGKGVTIIDGNELDRIFHIHGNANVTFENLTITGGFLDEDYGGGIYHNGNLLTLNNVEVTNSTVVDDVDNNTHALGGGIYVNNSTVVATGSDLKGNQAIRNGGNETAGGGGLFSNGGNANTSWTGGEISGNTARDGGGIYLWSDNSSLTLDGVTISGNEAISGGGIRVNDLTTTVIRNDSSIDDNRATGSGGGLYTTTGATVSFETGSDITNNSAQNSGAGFYAATLSTINMNDGTTMVIQGNEVEDSGGTIRGSGGGFQVAEGAQVNLDQVTISDNRADDGAGFYTLRRDTMVTGTNVTIENNTADVRGGGFRNAQLGAIVDLTDSVIENNYAQNEYGGGFYNNGTVLLHNVAIRSNEAQGLDEGTTNDDSHGGGFHNQLGEVTITGTSTIASNKAFGHGGGYWNRGGTVTIDGGAGTIQILSNIAGADSQGDAAAVGGARHGGGFYASDGGVTNLTNVDFIGNKVTANSSGLLTGVGGGFYAATAATVNLNNVDISNHSAESGGAFYVDSVGTTVTGVNVTLDDNTARTRGGAFRVANTFASVHLTDSSINNNTAENEHGGGFYNNGTVTLVNTSVDGNQALDEVTSGINVDGTDGVLYSRDSYGGGFYNTGGTVNLEGGTTVMDNDAYGHGGGFYTNGGLINASDTVISGNEIIRDVLTVGSTGDGDTLRHGGGFASYGDGVVNLTNVTLTGNRTGLDTGDILRGSGGGFYNQDGSIVNILGASIISSNQAQDGGGFYNTSTGGTVNILGTAASGTVIQNNTARVRGGGFRSTGGTSVNLEHVLIDGNLVGTERGGGFHADGAQVAGSFVTLSNNETTATSGNRQGGGGWASSYSVIDLSDSIVTDNRSNQNGGGFYIENATLNLIRTSIDDNYSQNSGGGLMFTGSSVFTAEDSSVSNNISRDHGGGIYITDDSKGTLTRTHIDDNLAGYEEDGVTRRESGSDGIGGTARGADLRGGGIRALGRTQLEVTNSTIDGNEAASYGGGIDTDNEVSITIAGSSVSENVAGNHGGGIRLASSAELDATNTTFSGNYSGFHRAATGTITADYDGRYGGALWSQSGSDRTYLNHVTITDNYVTAGGSGAGAGIYRSSGFIQAENSIIFGNYGDAEQIGTGGEDAGDVRGAITLVGGNVLGTHNTSGGSISGDTHLRITDDPNLQPLGAYGGFARSHAITPGSVALGAAVGSTISTDQTGLGRSATASVTTLDPSFSTKSGEALLEDPNFTLLDANRTPTLIGSSLNFPAGSVDNENLFEYQILPAGEFLPTYPISLTIDIDFTKITGDQDFVFTLDSGHNSLPIRVEDNDGGKVLLENTELFRGGEPATGTPATLSFTFTLTETGSTLVATRDTGETGSHSVSTVLSSFGGLSLRARLGNAGERSQLDGLTVSVSPAFINGQEGGADLGAYETEPVSETVVLDEFDLPETVISGQDFLTNATATTTGGGALTYDWEMTDSAGATVTTGSGDNPSFNITNPAGDPVRLLDVKMTVTDTITGQIVVETGQVRVVDPVAMPNNATPNVTVLTVDNSAGNTLRDHLITANTNPGNYVIDFSTTVDFSTTGTSTFTIGDALTDNNTVAASNDDANANGDLDISKTGSNAGYISIVGNGAAETIIDGGNLDRVFHVLSGSTVFFSNLTITGGETSQDSHGAGIRNEGGIIVMKDVDIVDNQAIRGANNDDDGGGIYTSSSGRNSGFIFMTNGSVSNNSSEDIGGGIYMDGNNVGESMLYLDGTVVSGNTASVLNANIDDQRGGGMYITDDGNRIVFNDVTISDNVTNGRNRADGGGIAITGADHVIEITNSSIIRNQAGSDAHTGGAHDADGGGLWVSGTRNELTFTNTDFGGELAGGAGAGGIGTARVDGNIAEDDGGGAYFEGRFNNYHFVDSSFIGNQSNDNAGGFFVANDTDTVNFTQTQADGVQIRNNFSLTSHAGGFWNHGVLNITGAALDPIEITHNEAQSFNRTGTNNSDRRGGGFWGGDNGTINLTDVRIEENEANRHGGGFWNSGGSTVNISSSDADVFKSTISNNINLDTSDGDGGGFYNTSANSVVNLTDVVIDGNTTTDDGGGFYQSSNFSATNLTRVEITYHVAQDDGGGFYNASSGSIVNMDDVLIDSNESATQHGGGFRNNGIVDGKQVTITNNKAGSSDFGTLTNNRDRIGGGFYNAGGITTLEDAVINDNEAYSRGGGIFNSGGGIVTVSSSDPAAFRSSISNNLINQNSDQSNQTWRDYGSGAGIHQETAGSVLNLIGVDMENNTSLDDGGAIFLESDGSFANLTDVLLNNNTARDEGGGMKINASGITVTLNNVRITNNIAGFDDAANGDHGGGIRNVGTIIGSDVLISNNIAGEQDWEDASTNNNNVGGGIYSSGGNARVELTRVTIADNDAYGRGGGIYNADGVVELTDFIVTGNETDQLSNESQGRAGGIWNSGGGSVILNRGEVSHNTSYGHSGGIHSQDNYSSIEATNVTFSNNLAGWDPNSNAYVNQRVGGAIWAISSGRVVLDHVTVTQNRTTRNSGNNDSGSGLRIDNGGMYGTISNSIISGNFRDVDATPINDNIDNNVGGRLTFTGNNIVGTSVGTVPGNSATMNRTDDPDLGVLADNGGYSRSHAPNVTDTAGIVDGAISSTTGEDQRGVSRPVGAAADIGAFESGASPEVTEISLVQNEVNENSVVTINGAGSSDGSAFDVTVDWGDGTPLQTISVAAGDYTFSATHIYADDGSATGGQGGYTVTVSAIGQDTGVAPALTETVTINNVNPAITVAGDLTTEEGTNFSLTGVTFTDPGYGSTELLNYTIGWGDGSAVDTVVGMEGVGGVDLPITGSHVYADNGRYTVTVTVQDDDGGIASETLLVVTNNAAPVASDLADRTEYEGATVSLPPFAFSDPGTLDTHPTILVDWGDGSDPVHATVVETPTGPPGIEGGTQFTISDTHTYAAEGTYRVSITVVDDDGGRIDRQFTISVVPPATDDPESPATLTTEEGTPLTIDIVSDLLANDLATDPTNTGDDDLSLIGVTRFPANGVLSLVNGNLVYTPNYGFSGTDSFDYAIDNGEGTVAATTASVSVVKTGTAADLTASAPSAQIAVERQNVKLGADLIIDSAINPAGVTYDSGNNPADSVITRGSIVNSHILHFNDSVSSTGSVTFDTEIIGIIWGDANLNASDGLLGSSTATYPNGTLNRGIIDDAGADLVTVSADGKTLSFSFDGQIDQIRVLTAPDPNETATVTIQVTNVAEAPHGGVTGTTDEDSSVTINVTDSNWNQQGLLTPDASAIDITDQDQLGQVVAIDYDAVSGVGLAVIGGDQTGVLEDIYVYRYEGGSWSLAQRIIHPDGVEASDDNFGYAVEVDATNEQIFIGAPRDDRGPGNNGGVVFVYDFNEIAEVWEIAQTIGTNQSLSGLDGDDDFGAAIDIYDNGTGTRTLVVGARLEDSGSGSNFGAVYVFTSTGGANWTYTQKLEASDEQSGDEFGESVAIDGDYIVIGAENEDTGGGNAGSAYIFKQSAQLVVDPASSDGVVTFTTDTSAIGNVTVSYTSVANTAVTTVVGVDTDTIEIQLRTDAGGVILADADEVAAAIENGGAGTATASGILRATVTGTGTDLVETAAATAVVGNWSEIQILRAEQPYPGQLTEQDDRFGFSVDISGDSIVVGARQADDPDNASWNANNTGRNRGAIHIFRNDGSDNFLWEHTELGDSKDDQFGISVAIEGDTVISGSYLDSIGGEGDRGSVIVLTRSGTTWTAESKYGPSDGGAINPHDQQHFGRSVSLTSDGAGGFFYLVGSEELDAEITIDGELRRAFKVGGAHVLTSGSDGAINSETALNIPAEDLFDFDADNEIGRNVSISADGNIAVVGAPLGNSTDDAADDHDRDGVVYVYQRNVGNPNDINDDTWTLTDTLRASNPTELDRFGNDVVISHDGSTIVVGAYDDHGNGSDSGSFYVFEGGVGNFTEQRRMSPASANDELGYSVAVNEDGSIIAAGARLDHNPSDDEGAVFVWTRNDSGTWADAGDMTRLGASDAAADDQFGRGLALSGNRLVVGAALDDDNGSNSGSAYVFEYDGYGWQETQKLLASDGAGNDRFGLSIDIHGDVIVVGSYLDHNSVGSGGGNSNDRGAAYVFRYDGASFVEEQQLFASNGGSEDEFGRSVAVYGDRLIVGAWQEDTGGSNRGAAYVFEFDGVGSWTETQMLQNEIQAPDDESRDFLANGDNFGISVDIGASTALVGAPNFNIVDDNGTPDDTSDDILLRNFGAAIPFELATYNPEDDSSVIITAADTTTSGGGTVTFDPATGEITFDPNGDFEHLLPGETETVTLNYTIQTGTSGPGSGPGTGITAVTTSDDANGVTNLETISTERGDFNASDLVGVDVFHWHNETNSTNTVTANDATNGIYDPGVGNRAGMVEDLGLNTGLINPGDPGELSAADQLLLGPDNSTINGLGVKFENGGIVVGEGIDIIVFDLAAGADDAAKKAASDSFRINRIDGTVGSYQVTGGTNGDYTVFGDNAANNAVSSDATSLNALESGVWTPGSAANQGYAGVGIDLTLLGYQVGDVVEGLFFSGGGVDFTLIRGIPPSSTVTAEITVTGVNDAPVATDDPSAATTDEDSTVSITAASLFGNDTDPDDQVGTVVEEQNVGGVDTTNTEGLVVPATHAIGEVGTLTNVTHVVQTVTFTGSYNNPVVIANSPTFNEADEAVVRISNITANSFDIYIAEPTNRDGVHTAETVSYMVMEAGTHVLEDGTRIEVGNIVTDNTVGQNGGFLAHSFSTNFQGTPTILTQIQTVNSLHTNTSNPTAGSASEFLKTRQQNSSATGFDVALENQDNFGAHPVAETIGYIAIEQGSGAWDSTSGFAFQAGSGTTVNQTFDPVAFDGGVFTTAPALMANMSTSVNTDDVQIRVQNISATGFQAKTEEDTTNDAEIGHSQEVVDFIAIEGAGLLYAIDPNGGVTYDPNGQFDYLQAGESATDTFEYTVRDKFGLESTATVTVTINGVNDAPVVDTVNSAGGAGNPAPTGTEGSLLTISDIVRFTDLDHTDFNTAATEDWSITVNWGDGTETVLTKTGSTNNDLNGGDYVPDNGLLSMTLDTSGLENLGDETVAPTPQQWAVDGSHVYYDGGPGQIYTVNITVNDGNGGVATHSFDVPVDNVAPIAKDDGWVEVWQVGIDNGNNSDFEQEGGTNAETSGSATSRDDDYFFAGTTDVNGQVYIDEPFNDGSSTTRTVGFERALTNGDKINRIHFNLEPHQVGNDFRMIVDVVHSSVPDQGFEFVVLLNGTQVHAQTVLENGIITVDGLSVHTVAGENIITLQRLDNNGGWMQFDRITLETQPQPFLELWRVGVDNGGNSDFAQESGSSNAAPGSATARDDDYYLAGNYPGAIGTVAQDESTSTNFERALTSWSPTSGDKANRIHFNLPQHREDGNLRLNVDVLPGSNIPTNGFDIEVRFNGTLVHSETVTQDGVLTTVFNANGGAADNDNVIEIRRTDSNGGWILFDYFSLDALSDYVTTEDGPAINVTAANGVLANDCDPADPMGFDAANPAAHNDTLTVTHVQGTALTGADVITDWGGSVTMNADGSFSYDAGNSAFFQTLAEGEIAFDTFTYSISDGDGGTSTATATITVIGQGAVEIDMNKDFPPAFGVNDPSATSPDTVEVGLNGGNLDIVVNGVSLRSMPAAAVGNAHGPHNITYTGSAGDETLNVGALGTDLFENLTIDTGSGADQVNFTTASAFLGSVDITSPAIDIAADLTTENTLDFRGAVTLSGNVVLESRENGDITFEQSVDGGNSLTINTGGRVNLGGDVGANTALTSLDVTTGNSLDIAAGIDITTTGDTTLTTAGNFDFDETATMTSNGGAIHINADQSAPGVFEADGATVNFLGTVSAVGEVFITGGNAIDVFNIKPSENTEMTVDGRNPTGNPIGDVLNIIDGIGTQKIDTAPGDGRFVFDPASSQKDVKFFDIERASVPSLQIDIPFSQVLLPTTLNGGFTDFGTQDGHTLRVEWQDGTVSFFTLPSIDAGLSAGDKIASSSDGAELTITSVDPNTGQVEFTTAHIYSADGQYEIAVTVVDDDGGTDRRTQVADVYFLAPNADGSPGFFSFIGPFALTGHSNLFSDQLFNRLFASDIEGEGLENLESLNIEEIGVFAALNGDVRLVTVGGERTPDDFLKALVESIKDRSIPILEGIDLGSDSTKVLELVADLIEIPSAVLLGK
ncbi:MAG: PKD domain-containing protein [Verrucomicrobiales bacterium]|nr:PKD domain-containing protein [Verrucomicrobiales bacterium]